jgi:hypothetical protein
MPVKIFKHPKGALIPLKFNADGSRDLTQLSSQGGHVVMSLTTLMNAKSDFAKNYFADSVPTSFSQSVSVNWNLFSSTVLSGISPADMSNVALNFIHRYDPAFARWYVCVEVVLLNPAPSSMTPDGDYNVYTVASKLNRYDIVNGSITPSTLPSPATFDQVYFDHIIDANGLKLDVNTNVNSITFPWQSEILKLLTDNNLNNSSNDVLLKIVCCTMDFSAFPDESDVRWPHGIAMYLTQNGTEYLDNNNYAVIFKNKGADFGSMCPPRCDGYWRPFALGL